jgi:hypothetical protein
MPFVLKTHPVDTRSMPVRNATFTEWAYRDARPAVGDEVAWFTDEKSGGSGLIALGRITSEAQDAGRNAKGNRLVTFVAEFDRFQPTRPLRKADFAALPRIGSGSPIQELNQRLYINSHVKVAEVNDDTFRFVAERFH